VPDESGARVPNPISLVSRWKILDNLRRSLVEPATFALLLFGWLVMDYPILWTLATICILFVPAWVEFGFGCFAPSGREICAWRATLSNLFAANFTSLLTSDPAGAPDAAVARRRDRALVRRLLTRERLLEWETAEEAELGERRTTVDRYLDWMPFLAIGLGLLIWLTHRQSLLAAAPILVVGL
jgi:cyclic beta-1,2-glucan synthetase